MDNVDIAQDSLEHAHGSGHASHAHAEPPAGTRRAAVSVAVFAAIAVIVEMSANDAQTAYLARIITANDLWNEYQAKSVRRTIRDEAAEMLRATGTGDEAGKAATRAEAEAARLADDPEGGGMKQLAMLARADERARDRALERHERLERGVRGLQIAIVLLGLFLATRVAPLFWGGVVLGGIALAWSVFAMLGP